LELNPHPLVVLSDPNPIDHAPFRIINATPLIGDNSNERSMDCAFFICEGELTS
jgi:hypothetical protein